jgi:acetyl esterase/lipase
VKLPRWIRRVALALAALVTAVILLLALGWWWLHPPHETTRGIVYTHRKGRDLTLDILRPAHPNGRGVMVMISGGWHSQRDPVQDLIVAPLLRRGYTVFAVTHGSQPEFTVMEIVADVQRAVRFVRFHAREYGVSPDRLGVAGGSSGGHLSLMIATRGGEVKMEPADPVDRCSGAVQAVACFFPVTDLLNLGASTENAGDGGPPRHFVRAFGPNSTNLALWKGIGRDLSPIYHVTSNLPPVLIIHGSADTLVPLDQSQRFAACARQAGRTVELIVRRNKPHGWPTLIWDVRRFADWFDRWLAG